MADFSQLALREMRASQQNKALSPLEEPSRTALPIGAMSGSHLLWAPEVSDQVRDVWWDIPTTQARSKKRGENTASS